MPDLQNPPVNPPETSQPPASSNVTPPVRFKANAAGIPDTSLSLGVMLQQPTRWSHDFDPDSGLSRAHIKAETPLFEQIPQAPTPPPGDSSQSLATTEFVYQSQEQFIDEAVRRAREGDITGFPGPPGQIGEYRSVNIPGPGTELQSGVIGVVASLELQAGDWDVTATLAFNITGLITPPIPSVYFAGAVNETPAFPGFVNFGGAAAASYIPSGADLTLPLYWRVMRAQATTLMLLAYASGFAPGRVFAYGFMQARRAR